MRISYVWALCRDQTELDPRAAWRLLDLSASSQEQFIWRQQEIALFNIHHNWRIINPMLQNKSNLENGRETLHYIIITQWSQAASQSVCRGDSFMSPGLCTVGALRSCLDGALSSGQWWWSGLNNLQQRADLSRIEDKLWPRSVMRIFSPLCQLLRVTSIQLWPDLAPVASISKII